MEGKKGQPCKRPWHTCIYGEIVLSGFHDFGHKGRGHGADQRAVV